MIILRKGLPDSHPESYYQQIKNMGLVPEEYGVRYKTEEEEVHSSKVYLDHKSYDDVVLITTSRKKVTCPTCIAHLEEQDKPIKGRDGHGKEW